jgi:hypothetical protein
MRTQKVVFTKAEFESYRQPAVYEVWEKGECTYVGFTMQGYVRIFARPQNNHRNRAFAFDRADQVVVSFYDTEKEAADMENQLIHQHHPRHNVMCDVCEKLGQPYNLTDPKYVMAYRELEIK